MNNLINIARMIEEQHKQMQESIKKIVKSAIGARENEDIIIIYYGFDNDALELGIYSMKEYKEDKENFNKFRYNSKKGYTNNFLSEEQVKKVLEVIPLEK